MGSVSPRELQTNFLGKKSTFTMSSFLKLSRIAVWSLLPFLALRVFLSCRSWEKRVFEHTCLRAAPGHASGPPRRSASPATDTLIPQHRHSPGSHDPMLGASTFPLKVVWGKQSSRRNWRGGQQIIQGQEVGQRRICNEDGYSVLCEMELWDLCLSLIACSFSDCLLDSALLCVLVLVPAGVLWHLQSSSNSSRHRCEAL